MTLPIKPRIAERHDHQNVSIRNRLIEETGAHCHWCMCAVWIHVLEEGEPMPDDHATVDHVKSRWEAETIEAYTARENMVLACHKCNQARAVTEMQALFPPKPKGPAFTAAKPKRCQVTTNGNGVRTMNCRKTAKCQLRNIHKRKGLPPPTWEQIDEYAKTLPGYGTPLYSTP